MEMKKEPTTLNGESENSLVKRYSNFINKEVGKFFKRDTNFYPDALQIGRLAFVEALRNYDSSFPNVIALARKTIRLRLQDMVRGNKYKAFTTSFSFYSLSIEDESELWQFLPENLSRNERIMMERHVDGHTYGEIATELDLSLLCVKSAIGRIKKKLKETYA